MDYAFNYGVFDFNKPNFYLNFALGHNYYMLGVYDYQAFQQSYIADNRYIHEQVLDLTDSQKQKVFNYLMWNAQPENSSYLYDYFYDNCATRIRDVIVTALGDDVTFDGSYITTDYTIRQLTDLYLTRQPWGDLGIDIGLGMPMDKKASPYEYMFLPDYVESGFDHATVNKDGVIAQLVGEKKIIYESRDEPIRHGLPHPLYVFGFLALVAIVLSVRDFKRQKLSWVFDMLLFGITGLLGILLLLLWFFTDHKAAANNLNILWALPTNFVAAIVLRKNARWLRPLFYDCSNHAGNSTRHLVVPASTIKCGADPRHDCLAGKSIYAILFAQRGRFTLKDVPSPSMESTRMVPLILSMVSLTI